MSVINRRNAVFGYTVLKVLERRRKQRRRNTARIALYVGLGVVSAGILAGLMAVLVRRHRDDAGEHADTVVEGGHVVSEPSATVSEPLPAT
ncbi:MAG: hypothetical protein M3Q59_01290 [Actinomycetota bacterium]|nr:hypothetical protein [Actinomycetota bacterium]